MLQVPALLSRTPSRSSPCPNVYTQEHLDVVIVDLAPVAAVALQGELRHGAQSGQARFGVHAAILEVCSDGDHLIQHAVCRGRGVLSNGLKVAVAMHVSKESTVRTRRVLDVAPHMQRSVGRG